MKTALIDTKTNSVVAVYRGKPPARIELGDRLQVHGATAGWEGEGFRLAEVVEATAPEGQRVRSATVEIEDGVPFEKAVFEDIPPPRVPTDVEKLEAATGLTVDQIKAVLGIGEVTR